ncbi:hypothetical protein K469DRAFT_693938 [Zopfia rhizophila CBS 207.26]|uniref:Uncharacterized protein n=1 Tax=Zopfia rhizophila CBS 207.26 TaxID=1314779 RepID=A0A6A6DJ63_9PEZI|nr:hypothetical protein K469DRAFT_693938 [Zopfia rhizophila CBS 207.26]
MSQQILPHALMFSNVNGGYCGGEHLNRRRMGNRKPRPTSEILTRPASPPRESTTAAKALKPENRPSTEGLKEDIKGATKSSLQSLVAVVVGHPFDIVKVWVFTAARWM